jgi:UMF1 family MFS transporter
MPNPYESPETTSKPEKPAAPRKLAIFSWAMYDWANSAFSTLSITIVASYISNVVFDEKRWGNWSGMAYPLSLSAATFLAAFIAPIVGSLADARATKHKWLAITAIAGAVCSLGVALVPAVYSIVIAILFAGAAFFFELSYGICNAFLPELTNEKTVNKVSALGFALGYVGGAIALLLAMVVLVLGESWGLSRTEQARVGVFIMGAWWGIFALPAILTLRDSALPKYPESTLQQSVKRAIQEVTGTLRNIRGYRLLMLFLIGYLFFNDCVQTVISQSPRFAEKDLGFQPEDLLKLVLMIQFVALPGALAMGWLSDRWGQKPVLNFCLITWGIILLSAWFVREQWHFWVLGVFVAIVMGGIQSVSRAIMGYITPPEKTAEFFGFFNLSSKATSFLGPIIFAVVYGFTQRYQLAIISLIGQLIIGFWIVSRVDIEQARTQALAEVDRGK